MPATPFKTCPCCSTQWATREAFLDDCTLLVNGYQADFEALPYGLFYFTHDVPGCGSTFTLHAKEFLDLYSGPRHTERKTLGPECPRLCMKREQLGRCEAHCECAFVREVLQVLRARRGGQKVA